MHLQTLVSRIALASLALIATGADWRQFRGNDTSGVSPQAGPKSWSSAAWKAELPGRGLSAPIIVGESVLVTCSSGYSQERLHVLSFDADTGDRNWERQFWATGRTMSHPKTAVAAPTPASDGERVFAFYSSNDLACLDLDGNLLWYRGLTHDFPNASNSLGMASSPVVVDETVIVQVETDDESFATGLDVETGVARWKIERPRRANWTSPTIFTGEQQTLVLLQSSEGVTAVNPRTGKEVWSYDDGASTIPSSVAAGGKVFVPSNGLTVLHPSDQGGTPEIAWQQNRLAPSTASPLVYVGHVFTLNRAGVLVAGNRTNGEVDWQLRLKGPFSGTPIAANDDHLYLINEAGVVQVVDVGESMGEVEFEFETEETVLCTPALAGGALYFRSDQHLWKCK